MASGTLQVTATRAGGFTWRGMYGISAPDSSGPEGPTTDALATADLKVRTTTVATLKGSPYKKVALKGSPNSGEGLVLAEVSDRQAQGIDRDAGVVDLVLHDEDEIGDIGFAAGLG